jgi:hypothetical protein
MEVAGYGVLSVSVSLDSYTSTKYGTSLPCVCGIRTSGNNIEHCDVSLIVKQLFVWTARGHELARAPGQKRQMGTEGGERHGQGGTRILVPKILPRVDMIWNNSPFGGESP